MRAAPDGTVPVAAVVFDLGGVIIDLAPLRQFIERHSISLEQFFAAALENGAHQRYERGDLSTAEYVTAFLGEFGLELDHDDFLADFAAWPGALYPGAAELVGELRATGITVAALSNSNPVHWASDYCTATVLPLFDQAFASHELRLAKPDRRTYEAVTAALRVEPAATLFFDDNQRNVDGAIAAGMRGHRVTGPDEARAVLVAHGLLDA